MQVTVPCHAHCKGSHPCLSAPGVLRLGDRDLSLRFDLSLLRSRSSASLSLCEPLRPSAVGDLERCLREGVFREAGEASDESCLKPGEAAWLLRLREAVLGAGEGGSGEACLKLGEAACLLALLSCCPAVEGHMAPHECVGACRRAYVIWQIMSLPVIRTTRRYFGALLGEQVSLGMTSSEIKKLHTIYSLLF